MPGRFLARFSLFVVCPEDFADCCSDGFGEQGAGFAWIFGLYPPVGQRKKIKKFFACNAEARQGLFRTMPKPR